MVECMNNVVINGTQRREQFNRRIITQEEVYNNRHVSKLVRVLCRMLNQLLLMRPTIVLHYSNKVSAVSEWQHVGVVWKTWIQVFLITASKEFSVTVK